MTRTIRSRRAGTTPQPLYARVLRLRHLAPSGLLCFVFLEGAVVLGILLALAELVSWWGVLVLPVSVALMVKFNDLVAGTFVQPAATAPPAAARATVLRPAAMDPAPSALGQSWVHPPTGHSPVDRRTTADRSFPAGQYGVAHRQELSAGPVQEDGYGSALGVEGADFAQASYGQAHGEDVATRTSSPAAGPVRRPWADQLDVRQQMARQSAVRRYE